MERRRCLHRRPRLPPRAGRRREPPRQPARPRHRRRTLGLYAVAEFLARAGSHLVFGVRLAGSPRRPAKPRLGQSGGAAALDIARHLVLPITALGAGYLALYARTLRAGMIAVWQRGPCPRRPRPRPRRTPADGPARRRPARPCCPDRAARSSRRGPCSAAASSSRRCSAFPASAGSPTRRWRARQPLLAGIVLVGACVVILANLLVDLALLRLDPRIGASDA